MRRRSYNNAAVWPSKIAVCFFLVRLRYRPSGYSGDWAVKKFAITGAMKDRDKGVDIETSEMHTAFWVQLHQPNLWR
jgi:hypothetical protein